MGDAVHRGTGDRQRLVAVARRDDHLLDPVPAGHERRGKAAGHPPHGTVERQLTEHQQAIETAGGHRAVRRQDP